MGTGPKTAFATFVTNQEWLDYCAIPLRESARHFHPDIDFFLLDQKEVGRYFSLDPFLNIGVFKPTIGYNLSLQGYERVIIIDADSIIVAPLTELLADTWDIVGVRNNSDLDTAGNCTPFAGFYDGKPLPASKYLNAGLVGIKGKDIWAKFGEEVRSYASKCGDAEQGVWNAFFYRNNYNKLLLDPKDKPYFYGIASTWGTKSHWDSWQNIRLKEDKLMLASHKMEKQVKILHKAGGCSAPARSKFHDSLGQLFKQDVANFIRGVAYNGLPSLSSQ